MEDGKIPLKKVIGMRKFRDGAIKLSSAQFFLQTSDLKTMIDEIAATSDDEAFWKGVTDAIPKRDSLPLKDFSDALHVF